MNPYLAHLVHVADLISSRFTLGHNVNNMDTSHLRSSLDAIDFDTGDFPGLLANASNEAFAITNGR